MWSFLTLGHRSKRALPHRRQGPLTDIRSDSITCYCLCLSSYSNFQDQQRISSTFNSNSMQVQIISMHASSYQLKPHIQPMKRTYMKPIVFSCNFRVIKILHQKHCSQRVHHLHRRREPIDKRLVALVQVCSSSCINSSASTGGHHQILLPALIKLCSSSCTSPSAFTDGYHQILLLITLV